MNINQATLDLIKSFEGLRLKAYKCPADRWTVGYGLTTAAGIGIAVGPDTVITEEQAEEYLLKVLQKFAASITPGMTRLPTENQFGAMLSLAYNIGPGAFLKSTCLKRFNAGDIEGAAQALTWFNKAGGKVLNGLVRRRSAERELFLSDDVSEVPTPQPDPERGPASSTTFQAAAGAVVAGGGGVMTALSKLDPTAQYIILGFAAFGAICIGWMVKERVKRWANGDR